MRESAPFEEGCDATVDCRVVDGLDFCIQIGRRCTWRTGFAAHVATSATPTMRFFIFICPKRYRALGSAPAELCILCTSYISAARPDYISAAGLYKRRRILTPAAGFCQRILTPPKLIFTCFYGCTVLSNRNSERSPGWTGPKSSRALASTPRHKNSTLARHTLDRPRQTSTLFT